MKRSTELFIGLRSLFRLYDKMLKRVCTEHDLTLVEADIISFLQNNPEKDTAADIVELRMLSKGAVSKGVEALIQKSLLERTGADDRGARRARFAVLRTTNMPACLVEIGFLSNNAECLKLATPSYRLKIANAIANGIVRYESAVKNAASRSRR